MSSYSRESTKNGFPDLSIFPPAPSSNTVRGVPESEKMYRARRKWSFTPRAIRSTFIITRDVCLLAFERRNYLFSFYWRDHSALYRARCPIYKGDILRRERCKFGASDSKTRNIRARVQREYVSCNHIILLIRLEKLVHPKVPHLRINPKIKIRKRTSFRQIISHDSRPYSASEDLYAVQCVEDGDRRCARDQRRSRTAVGIFLHLLNTVEFLRK